MSPESRLDTSADPSGRNVSPHGMRRPDATSVTARGIETSTGGRGPRGAAVTGGTTGLTAGALLSSG
jgi:hypothetical protein